jgi:hypothetical protein
MMKTLIVSLLLILPVLAQDADQVTLAMSPEFMVIHEKRLGAIPDHARDLQRATRAHGFRVFCLGEKSVATYYDTRLREERFRLWLEESIPQVIDRIKEKDKENAEFGSSVALDNRLLNEKNVGKEIIVILDWPCLHQGEVPGPEAFRDPNFKLTTPSVAGTPQLRGEIYWYFSPAVLESSLGKLLDNKDPAEKEIEIDRCRLALGKMWSTYFRAQGFRLMAFDAAVPGRDSRPQNLANALSADLAAHQEIQPYDLSRRLMETAPDKPIEKSVEKPVPKSIKIFIEWQGNNVILPAYRGVGKTEPIFPAAATEIPNESQRSIFKAYRAFASQDGKEIEIGSRRERYQMEIEGPVTNVRELQIPVGEDGRIRGKLQLYLYEGKVRSAVGFKVYIRKDDRSSPVIQTLTFRDVDGRRENGLTDTEKDYWKTIDLNN